jgi:nicotinate dehydrogenase subunit B
MKGEELASGEGIVKSKSISRRQFAKGTGLLVVGFNLFGSRILSEAAAQSPPLSGVEPEVTSLDSWLGVAQDGSVTVFTSKVDLGTGVLTALSQVVAEELDVSFDQIHMKTGDTENTIDQSQTSGSRTLHKAGPQLRQAAAAGRRVLLNLASARFGVPVEKLRVSDGIVTVIGSTAKKVSYGDLIGGRRFDVKITASGTGANLKVAPEIPAKDSKNYKIVGTSVPRVDLPAKLTGEFTYSIDVSVPGMLHGRVVRPPVADSKPLTVDENSIADIPGIVRVVREGGFLGVVATTEWSAIQAAGTLKVTWSALQATLPANREELFAYLKNAKSYDDQVVANHGNLETAFAAANKTFEATYRWPFQMHGMLGPSCAVADVREEQATIWTGTQGPFRTRKEVAKLLRRPEKSVRIVYVEEAGCYGRLCADDVAEDAAVLSRAVGKPVRVQWTRADEHGWEPKGPPQLMIARAGVDAAGNITAWEFADRSIPWTAAPDMPNLASRQTGMMPQGPGSTGTGSGVVPGVSSGGDMYSIKNQKITAPVVPWVQNLMTPLRTNNLRAPGSAGRCFGSETFMDEIASQLGVDPVQFRLRHFGNDKRKVEALLAATKKAGWKQRPSPAPVSGGSIAVGRGVAVSNREDTVVAAVAEVEVDKSDGKVKVRRVVVAHDCGLIANPNGVENQIDGNVIQGVSRTLLEEVQFDARGVQSLDWIGYPVIRYEDIPEVEIVLINRPELDFLGAGEASLVPIPAAIGNAIFDATGARVRDIPMSPERVLAALKARSAAHTQA